MFCKQCGNQLADTAAFCPNCGSKIETPNAQSVQNVSAPVQPVPKSAKNNLPIIIVAVLCGLLLLAAALIFGLKLLMPKTTKPEVPITPAPIETLAPQNNVEGTLNSFISSTRGHRNISVAVVDNKTNHVYYSENGSDIYPAWGFYLPIYLAAEHAPSYVDSVTRSNILSSDPGACNTAGNAVIQKFGGPAGISDFLRYEYNAASTSYGRYFGDVSSAGQNLTTAAEAVRFLHNLNGSGEYAKLSYNIASFGIQPPTGAQIYAQVGTENKAKLENLNLFAIVKGQNANYCVAVMTRNGAGQNGLISNLLFTLHQEMERISA